MSESQTWISFLSTRNPALKMRPLAYCFIKTCLFAGPYSAFMSLFITGETLWTFPQLSLCASWSLLLMLLQLSPMQRKEPW